MRTFGGAAVSPPAKVRHTKESALGRVEAEFQALDRVVRRLRPADFRRPAPGFGERARIARERWTAKDALAHILEEFFTGTPRSPLWPNDLVGHSAGHRRRHLEPVRKASPR